MNLAQDKNNAMSAIAMFPIAFLSSVQSIAFVSGIQFTEPHESAINEKIGVQYYLA